MILHSKIYKPPVSEEYTLGWKNSFLEDRGQEVSWRNKKQQLSAQKRQMLMSQASRKQQNPVLTLYVTFGGGSESRYTFYYFSLQIAKNTFYSTCSWYCLTVLSQVETVFHHDKAKKKKLTQVNPKSTFPKSCSALQLMLAFWFISPHFLEFVTDI